MSKDKKKPLGNSAGNVARGSVHGVPGAPGTPGPTKAGAAAAGATHGFEPSAVSDEFFNSMIDNLDDIINTSDAKGASSRPDGAQKVATGQKANASQKAATGQKTTTTPDASSEMDEQAMVDEAIRRGEQAAEQDMKKHADELQAAYDELAAKLETLTNERNDAQQRVARLQADWDNYRKRIAGERLAERVLATEKLVCNLLPVIDDLERALAHAQTHAQGNEDLQQFADGVSAVRTKFLDVLSKEDVELIDPAGEEFDPLSHQAVGRVDDVSVYADTVRDVYQLGYRMGTKVIRPAMVTVTYNGPSRPATPKDGTAEKPDESDAGAQKTASNECDATSDGTKSAE